jgi:1-phosphofructokinase family hexose kinase
MERFSPGTSASELPASTAPSGKAIGVARVIRTLGEEVKVIGCIPRHSAGLFESFLRSFSIRTALFQVESDLPVHTTLFEQELRQTTSLAGRRSSLSSNTEEDFFDYVSRHMKSGDYWIMTGGLPYGFDATFYRRLISICREKSIMTILDTQDDALKSGIGARPHVIKPNSTELEHYFDEQIAGVHHIALKAKRFIDLGIEYVLISLGSDGLIAIHKNDCLLCSAPQIEAVETNGCGDAMVGGIAVGIRRNFAFSEICRLALACGTSKAMYRGQGRISLDTVWQLMEEIDIQGV